LLVSTLGLPIALAHKPKFLGGNADALLLLL
jgi:hypothetical protein